jgi:hypothetical protein
MNEKIRKHLVQYCEKNGWEMGLVSEDEDFEEILTEAKTVYEEKVGSRRWWDDYFTAVDVCGLLIGFKSAKTTGDDSPWDKGWEFGIDSVCEVVRTEETQTIVKYSRKT